MCTQLTAAVATLVALLLSYVIFKKLTTPKHRQVLSRDHFQEFPLAQKTVLSHNSGLYRFKLPKETDILGLPIGQHIQISAMIGDKEVVRSYTPVSIDNLHGYFDLLIKHYPQGNISKFINELKIGDSIKVKGPKGFFKYTPNMVTDFGMVAGGTGITPMFQIIKAIALNPEDKTRVVLLYGSRTEEDILLRAELDEYVSQRPDQFQVHHFLDQPPAEWDGFTGPIKEDHLQSLLPTRTPKTQVLICGPPPMVNSVKKIVHSFGFQKAKPVSKAGDQIFVF